MKKLPYMLGRVSEKRVDINKFNINRQNRLIETNHCKVIKSSTSYILFKVYNLLITLPFLCFQVVYTEAGF